MNPFSLSGLLAGISSFALGLLVLRKSADRKIARTWFLFSLSAAAWGFGSLAIGYTQNPAIGLLTWRISYAFGVIWISPIFYHFVRTFVGERFNRFIILNYIIALIFCCTVPTNLFFKNADFIFNEFYYARGGPVYALYFTWWIFLVLLSHVKLMQSIQTVSPSKRNQIQYFLLAIAVGFGGGSLSYLPNFGIDIYPWGNFTITLYPLIMSYAILKYRLMDIRLFFRRAGLLLLVYATLILISIPLVILIHHKITQATLTSQTFLVIEVFSLAMILSVGPFIYAYIVRQTSLFNEDTIASLTHELKGPLASVEGAFDFILESEKIAPLENPQKEVYNGIIQRNLSRLSHSVDELIQVMQFQHSKGIVNKTDQVDLSQLIIESQTKYQSLADMKGLKMESDLTPLLIACDPVKIEQTVSNLISNAIKFSNKGKITIHLKKDQHEATIQITDEGQGIQPQDLNRIFDRFFQGSKDKTAKGTGIGLTIAKTWVEAHGGKIWAESEGEGNGTTMSFTLPL